MTLMRNIRFLILAAFALISIYLLTSTYLFKQSGVIVSFLDKTAKCSGIKEGDAVSQVGGYSIKSSDDFKKAVKNFKEGDYITLVVNNMPSNCYVISNGSVGVSVVDAQSTKNIFGMEFQGGIRSVLKPEKNLTQDEMNDVINILDKRIKDLNLLQGRVERWREKINVTTLTEEKIGMLIMRGEIFGVVAEEVKIQNNTGKVPVQDNTYNLELSENKVKILNSSYAPGESFRIEDVNFEVKNITNASVLLEATFLTNKDVLDVLSGETVNYNSNARRYEYAIPLQIKNESSNRFVKIVKKIPVVVIGNGNYFSAFLRFYFDGNMISQLNIPTSIIENEIKVLSVIGFSDSKTDALNEMTKIHASVKSGELTEKLEVEYSERVEATSKNTLIVILALMSAILLLLLILARLLYKNFKTGLLFGFLMLLELISILGLAVINQMYLGVGWLIDSTTFAGMIVLALLVSVEMFIAGGYILKGEKYRNVYNKTKYLSSLLAVLGICLLFTSIKNLGLVLFFGELIHILLIKPIYTAEIKKFTI